MSNSPSAPPSKEDSNLASAGGASQVQNPSAASSGAYSPKEVEARWSKHWHDNKLFDLRIEPDRPRFSIALPPPNITGNLHMGHALNGTLQDLLIRLKRMQGYNVLWQPGTDHAGISTQMVVERQLKKEGKNRHQLGREAFLEKVWEWRNQYGNQIMEQYKRLGVSFSWDRVAFTMDESYVKAIYRAFVTLYKEGYIYRGNRVTNWCPRCLTVLSDLEVVHEDKAGHLYLINYVLEGGKDGEGLTVATTRPETLFGDVAVAVHPSDDRYKSWIGKTVKLPLTNRPIPVIADSYVEREFGTGALKITPAHDANDFEVGQRHNLDQPVVIDKSAKMIANDLVPEYLHGMNSGEARKLTVEKLEEAGLLKECKDYTSGVGHCERCNTVIEPLLSEQWYLSMKELAQRAIEVVEEQRVQFVPERYSSSYLDWMRNIRDWCLSRQLWWGHRIPIWTCSACNNVEAFEEPPTACSKCNSKDVVQDEDVLDTWFSSALWPFATLGWPGESEELKTFYPTTVLSTAREIINLWVARMIFMSMKFMKTIPFKHVLIHPVIQTGDGKRMSKSKGNAIDPIDMIEKYGCDANRFWFASIGVKGDQDVRFRDEKLEEYKRFANKIWQAGNFVLSKLDGFKVKGVDQSKLTLADKWVLHRYNIVLDLVQMHFDGYDFEKASSEFYEFIWDDFCSWYLEIAKIQLAQEATAEQTKIVLYTVFEGLMRALHPIMPFITEELWNKFPKSEFIPPDFISIMFAPYPRPDENFVDEESEERMAFLIRVIRSIRNIRQTYNVPASSEAEVMIVCRDEDEMKCLVDGSDYIRRLAKVSPLDISMDCSPPTMAACEAISSVSIYVPLAKLIDVEKSREKLNQRKQAIEKDMGKVNLTMSNPDFKTKAPPEKVNALESQLADLQRQLESVISQLKVLEKG